MRQARKMRSEQHLSRRMFLRGLGGSALAIPYLPSLLTRSFAQESSIEVRPNFFAICTDHGGVWGRHMFPSHEILTQSMNYAQRDIRYGSLLSAAGATPDAQGKVNLSAVCSADQSLLTPSVLSKMNIYRGLDIPYRIGHHRGGHLGNFSDTDGQVTGGLKNSEYQCATIDQFLAYSPSFYNEIDLNTRMTQRSFCIGDGRYSQNFTRPQTKSGEVVRQPSVNENLELFNYLFQPGSSLGGVDRYLIDRVKLGYDRLKLHPRLSKGDRARLEQHLDQMFEIERKLRVGAALTELPPTPSINSRDYSGSHAFHHSASLNINYADVMTDLIALAFSTGTSRIGTWAQDLKFIDTMINDWHGQVAHSGLGASVAQEWVIAWQQGSFEHVFTRLAYKLDQITAADGQSLLDHSLIMMTSEAGQYTHHSSCVHYPVITAGRAGGYFNTGLFVDYGDPNRTYTDLEVYSDRMPLDAEHPGLYYNQYLANVLYAMGIPQEELGSFRDFTSSGPRHSDPTGGYGFHYVDPQKSQDYLSAKAVMSEALPVVCNT